MAQHTGKLTLYNTLGREMRIFEPLVQGRVGFYGCGPTVYNYAHIGNLRAYVTHDILVRTLRRMAYDVTHVMNITDVGHLSGDNDEGDDKMLKSAEERGKSVLEIADFYTKAFFNDTERMNVNRPTVVCKATEHIGEIIDLIGRIEANGYTYLSGGNLYFDVGKFPTYGELFRRNDSKTRARARVQKDPNKRNPQDFVLWFTKSKFEDHALAWDSPWGRGYPGWHIECSAMSMKYLGEQFDIHAGGVDHVPIHHTNEIAQSEAATGKRPWVNFWVHNEFLVQDKGKMSKSSGGFLTLQSLVDAGYDPLDYRYFLLGGHYRSQLQFSWESLETAKNARRSLVDRIRALAARTGPGGLDSGSGVSGLSERANDHLEAFNRALEDDLSTPRALAELWGLIRNPDIEAGEALACAVDMDRVLGFKLDELARAAMRGGDDSGWEREIERLVAERTTAKKVKDYAKADKIRAMLKEQGILLEDGPAATFWHKIQGWTAPPED
ncbi:MAG: cysteine--tRNA ligase [Treponema sp.]|jgi:cysteinyl-tRNA synthetase|nr:cysteine--tRNA ligase [Treponema sp.]